jgi:hypothetical protein
MAAPSAVGWPAASHAAHAAAAIARTIPRGQRGSCGTNSPALHRDFQTKRFRSKHTKKKGFRIDRWDFKQYPSSNKSGSVFKQLDRPRRVEALPVQRTVKHAEVVYLNGLLGLKDRLGALR